MEQLIIIPNYRGFDTLRFEDEERGKLSAVHFVRFALPPDARERFATSEVALAVEHPNARARTVLSDETKRSLLADVA